MQAITLNTSVGPLAANLYLPEGVQNPPVVIVTGAWTTVKEQMPATYAKALADKGYAALTFDFRGWGASKDALPYLESPARKTEDIRAVIDAVSDLEGIDSKRIAGLGICASSGYMLDAAAGNANISAVAIAAPWLHNEELAAAIYGGDDAVASLKAASNAAEAADTPVTIEAASMTNPDALMYQAPYYTEIDRGLISEYDNCFNVASWRGWLTYDPISRAAKQDKPVLLVASQAMALPAGTEAYLANAGDNVKALWLDDVNQFDFYDNTKAVAQTINAISDHFQTNL